MYAPAGHALCALLTTPGVFVSKSLIHFRHYLIDYNAHGGHARSLRSIRYVGLYFLRRYHHHHHRYHHPPLYLPSYVPFIKAPNAYAWISTTFSVNGSHPLRRRRARAVFYDVYIMYMNRYGTRARSSGGGSTVWFRITFSLWWFRVVWTTTPIVSFSRPQASVSKVHWLLHHFLFVQIW